MNSKLKILWNQLESLHKAFLGIKMLYSCTLPKEEHKIKNKYFNFLNFETKKLIIGKLYIILSEDKDRKYNNISLKILLNDLIELSKNNNPDFLCHIQREKLERYYNKIPKADSKFKEFRNKSFAHVELDENNELKSIKKYGISNKDITCLITFIEKIFDCIYPVFHSTRHFSHLPQKAIIIHWFR